MFVLYRFRNFGVEIVGFILYMLRVMYRSIILN